MSSNVKPSLPPNAAGVIPNRDRLNQTVPSESYLRPIQNVTPGPKDLSILELQKDHRSSDIWESEDKLLWHVTMRVRTGRVWIPHPNLHRFIMDAGFLGIMQIQFVQQDHALMTALVERWRQETHTFHFPAGEMTVTLEDVAILLGLPIDGEAVTGSHNCDWIQLCKTELGLTPGENDVTGSSLQLKWLSDNFSELPEAENFEPEIYRNMLKQFAKAWLLAAVGQVICPTSSGDTVSLSYLLQLVDLTKVINYSWGSAVLANLYRGLCRASKRGAKELSGCALLLQLWSWERLHIGRPDIVGSGIANRFLNGDNEDAHAIILHPDIANSPCARFPWGYRWTGKRTFVRNPRRGVHYYRTELDSQKTDEVKWQPYENVNQAEVSPLCFSGRDIWRARVPLICYEVVEWHFPHRVLRQFGLFQEIPISRDTELKLHNISKRGRHNEEWDWTHRKYVAAWGERRACVENSRRIDQVGRDRDNKYLQWYRKITRRFVAPPEVSNTRVIDLKYHGTAALEHRMAKALAEISEKCARTMVSRDLNTSARQGFLDIRAICLSALADVGEKAEPVISPPARRRATARVMARGESSNGDSRPPRQTEATRVRERSELSHSAPSRLAQRPQEPKVRERVESSSGPSRPLPRPTQGRGSSPQKRVRRDD